MGRNTGQIQYRRHTAIAQDGGAHHAVELWHAAVLAA